MKKRNADEDENEEQQPPRRMIKIVRGQERKYQFLKTVKSVDELDHIRYEVFWKINGSKLFVENANFYWQWIFLSKHLLGLILFCEQREYDFGSQAYSRLSIWAGQLNT
jgi:hypothetical protein